MNRIVKKAIKWKTRFSYYALDSNTSRIVSRLFYLLFLRNKRIVGCYGECHFSVYSRYIYQIKELWKKYYFIFCDDIYNLDHKNVCNPNIWNKLDYLVYNPGFNAVGRIPSFNEIKSWLKRDCQLISITNMVFEGYFPQHTNRVFPNEKYFVWGDKNLNSMLQDSLIDHESIEHLQSLEFYSSDDVERHFDRSLKRLKRLEKECDVRIADYIEENGRDRVLFYSSTHPENEVMEVVTKRIINALGADCPALVDSINLSDYSIAYDLHCHGEVVYPSVWVNLGIKGDYRDRRIVPGKHKECTYSFDEYIIEYLRCAIISSNTEENYK